MTTRSFCMGSLYMNGSTTAGQGRKTNPHRLYGPVTTPLAHGQRLSFGPSPERTRQRTLGLMQAWQNALPDLSVPPLPGMNPPLWEWGHIAWFQEWWTVRNRQRHLGTRSASCGEGFDAFTCMPRCRCAVQLQRGGARQPLGAAFARLAGDAGLPGDVLQRSLAHLQAWACGPSPRTRRFTFGVWSAARRHAQRSLGVHGARPGPGFARSLVRGGTRRCGHGSCLNKRCCTSPRKVHLLGHSAGPVLPLTTMPGPSAGWPLLRSTRWP
jgi:hypothetical protein